LPFEGTAFEAFDLVFAAYVAPRSSASNWSRMKETMLDSMKVHPCASIRKSRPARSAGEGRTMMLVMMFQIFIPMPKATVATITEVSALLSNRLNVQEL